MNIKKISALFLTFCIISLNTLPASAIQLGSKKNKQTTQDKNAYKYEYLNYDWWKSYNDEYLNEYIEKAINNSPDLQTATLKVEQSRQNVKLQFSQELPSASVGVSPALFKIPTQVKTSSSFSVPMIVNYEADIFLKNHNKTQSVKKLYEASQYSERAAYITIASQIGSVYFNIVKLDKMIDLQQQIINDRKQIFLLMKARNDFGLTSTADLTKAEKSYVLSVADMSDLQKARNIFLNALAVLVGDSPEMASNYKRISYDKLVALQTIPKSISSDVIENRPDYLISKALLEKSAIDVKVAKKEFLPTINIFGLYSFGALHGMSGGMSWESSLAALAGSLMLDVFKGGAKIANLKLNKNLAEQRIKDYVKTGFVAEQEINDSLCALKYDKEKYDNTLYSYKMQEKEFGYTTIKFKHGLISELDLIQQRETLLTMDKMLVGTKTNCYIDQISLYKAVGAKM